MNKNTIDTKYIKLGKGKLKVFFILFIFCEVDIKIGKDFLSALHFVTLNLPGGKDLNFFFIFFVLNQKLYSAIRCSYLNLTWSINFTLYLYLNNRICSIYDCGSLNNILFPLNILFRMHLGMILENISSILNT